MAQQEQNQKYSNSGCTGGVVARSSKKLKQKKVPQRGLGVAQLEKIRLEEQQKRDAIFQVPSAIVSPSNSSSCLASQCSNFRPDVSSYLTSASPIDHPLTNKINRLPPVIPNRTDIVRSNSVSNNGGECEMGWQDTTSAGRGSWSMLWNDEFNLEGDANFKLDHQGSNALRSSVNLFSETKNSIWPLPGGMPRSHPSQEACPSSMVNVSIGTSSSSVMNFQTEPPSNQRYHGNKSMLLWPAEERMAGLKRSYPFSIDEAPVPSFNCRFPPTYASQIPRTDESASLCSETTFDFVQASPLLIEGPSGSSGISEHNKRNIIKENGGFNNHFLTLAPPTPKDPPSYLDPCIRELPDFDALPYQGAPDDPVRLPGLTQSVEKPFFSFLPSAQNGRSTVTKSNNNDVVDNVDLSLKL
ncbi:Actin cytoskeleton-regulatory complex protein pan1 [Heracleum sosnowskyi]|uniref:Actin cytoskeleton-regulatory complex protein pan1 n=1 Tax=Heracleum sosnowskyi TaxID=360622 RepID=A0AAD8J0Q7_9APIA|nr:Actin cytoskeleton-regulatory complex protein pan1 [Heracleum sosnowskyi]